MTDHSHTTNTSIAFTTGLLIGAALAALFTPRRGQDVRQSIKKSMSDMKHGAGEVASELKDGVQTTVKDAKQNLSRSKDKAEDTFTAQR